MGLDTVELVMEIEDTFEVKIPDADAERMMTPGDVADWLVKRLMPPAYLPPTCMSARAFYFLRSGLRTTYGVKRRDVRPATLIGDLIPVAQREGWRRFARDHGLPRPPFRWFAEPFAAEGTTVADLAHAIAAYRPGNWFDRDGRPDRAAVLHTVLRLTSEQMGVRLEDLGEQTHFINDLGMG